MSYTCPEGHPSTSGDYCDVCGAPIGQSGGPPPVPGPAGAAAPPPLPANPLDLGGPPPLPGSGAAAPTDRSCPNCGASNLPDALYCEDCGYDFTTGQLPRPLDPPPGVAAPAPSAPAAPAPVATADLPTAGNPTLAPPVTATSAPGHVEWVAEVWVDPDWYASQDVSDPCPSPGVPWVVPVLERSVLIGRVSHSRNIHPQIDVSSDSGVSRRHAQLTSDGQRWWVEDLQSANGTYVGAAGSPVPTTPVAAGQRIELADDDRIYVGAWTRIVVRRATGEEADLAP